MGLPPNNCPVMRTDIKATEDIFGPNLGSLKGKAVHRKVKSVEVKVYDIPWSIIEWY